MDSFGYFFFVIAFPALFAIVAAVFIARGAKRYDDAIRTNPTPDATLESAVWWKGRELGWHSGRLILQKNELILKTDEQEIFTIPLHEVTFEFISPSSGFYIRADEHFFWIRLYVAPMNPLSILRLSDRYEEWNDVIAASSDRKLLGAAGRGINSTFRIMYGVLFVLVVCGVLSMLFAVFN